MSDDFSPAEFGAAWQKFIEYVNGQIPTPEPPAPPLMNKLLAFMEADPTQMVILNESFLVRELPNVQLAFNHYLTGPERFAEQLGYVAAHDHPGFGLISILSGRQWQMVTEGPVQYRSVELANGERLQCMEKGLYLIRDHGQRAVAFVHTEEHFLGGPPINIEIMCPEADRAEAMLAELRELVYKHNVYRGHVISLGGRGPDDIRFHHLPVINREEIILPQHLLETVERNTVVFAEHSARLLAAGRHLRRGLLFHGAPGTGKTLTIMYLAAQMKGRTIILMTGRMMGLIGPSCQLARALAPAVVVMEDVDLIAVERGRSEHTGPLLFELLNEMDGLAEDTDVVFLLSTNRPDTLEPALVARPGRIDQAIEFPLPDADCRKRLIQLYGRGLEMQLDEAQLDDMVRRTDGASPAFIRELLRKAALLAAEETRGSPDAPIVNDTHLREALFNIVREGGQLTKKLLGVRPEALEI
jgi:hypothetical protein